jgi:hypothetical protein
MILTLTKQTNNNLICRIWTGQQGCSLDALKCGTVTVSPHRPVLSHQDLLLVIHMHDLNAQQAKKQRNKMSVLRCMPNDLEGINATLPEKMRRTMAALSI